MNDPIGPAVVQQYADAAAAALDALRAQDFPFTERVDLVAEMCAAWLKAADVAAGADERTSWVCAKGHYNAYTEESCFVCGRVVPSNQTVAQDDALNHSKSTKAE